MKDKSLTAQNHPSFRRLLTKKNVCGEDWLCCKKTFTLVLGSFRNFLCWIDIAHQCWLKSSLITHQYWLNSSFMGHPWSSLHESHHHRLKSSLEQSSWSLIEDIVFQQVASVLNRFINYKNPEHPWWYHHRCSGFL